AYWYNGFVYGSEIARGIDVFRLTPSESLSQNEIDAAVQIRSEEVNTQFQTRITWPATSVTARAYLDQLSRTNGIRPERARAIRPALGRADGVRDAKDKNAAAIVGQLDALAAQVDGDAAAASGRDALRLKALAETIKGRAARLRS